METLDYPKNYFYFASQFHGEFKSRPGRPSPEYFGFIQACVNKKLGKPKANVPIVKLLEKAIMHDLHETVRIEKKWNRTGNWDSKGFSKKMKESKNELVDLQK